MAAATLRDYADAILVRHIKAHPTFKWNWDDLSLHPQLTTKVLAEFSDKPWNFYKLSTHENFEFAWVEVLPEKSPWDWATVSGRVESMDIVLKNPTKPWDWSALTLNDNINEDDMIKNPDLPWVFGVLGYYRLDYPQVKILRFFRNKFNNADWRDFTGDTPWHIIKTNLDIPWDPLYINFTHGDITSDDDISVIEYFIESGFHVNWVKLSLVADISVIKDHPELPWDWSYVSMNPTLKADDVDPDHGWDYNFTPIKDDTHKWVAARRIQREWRRCVSDPSHPICARRLMREFNSLVV